MNIRDDDFGRIDNFGEICVCPKEYCSGSCSDCFYYGLTEYEQNLFLEQKNYSLLDDIPLPF